MVSIRPIPKALVPKDSAAADAISAPNYDEFQSDQEIWDLLQKRRKNILRVTMAHCDTDDLSKADPEGSPEALARSRRNMQELKDDGLTREVRDLLYVYEIRTPKRPDRRQIGLGGFASTAEIRTDANPRGCIVRNEGIRQKKADGRARLIEATNSYIGAVNCAVLDEEGRLVAALESEADSRSPDFETVDEGGNQHRVWLITDDAKQRELTGLLAQEAEAYVADGNHRSAAAASLGKENFLGVFFTASRLGLEPYNRLVEDCGVSAEELISRLTGSFEVVKVGPLEEFRPAHVHKIGLYTGGSWYELTPDARIWDPSNAAEDVDADIVQKHIFAAILGIDDPKDERINFVGGNKDSRYLKARVDSGEYAYAISLAPVLVSQFVDICKQNRFMPPKSTWFDPKIRSGLVIALLD